MKVLDFVNTWKGSLVENKWNRVINLCLVLTIAGLVVGNLNKDKIVVIKPASLNQEAWIGKESSSSSYKESWGLYLAELTGNVTPATVDFLISALKPLLSPTVYKEVIDSLLVQAQAIKDDRITMRFEPRVVEYEPVTDKVFVYGYSFVSGADGVEVREGRTYEYRLRIENYAPLIVDINTYAGKPRSELVLAGIANKKESENRRSER